MLRLLSLATAITVAASLSAQSTFTSPAGYDSKPGNRYGSILAFHYATASFTSVRVQSTDQTLPAGKTTLTQMELRTSANLSYRTYFGMGRVMKGATLTLGNAVGFAKFAYDRSKNWASPGTKVFSAATLILPSFTSGKPKQIWGNVAKVPFASGFLFDAAKGRMLQEWGFSSGVLANGYTGGSNYYLDGMYDQVGNSQIYMSPSSSTTAANRFVPKYFYNASGGACNDAAITDTTSSAYAYLSAVAYADNYPVTSLRGAGQITSNFTRYTAPGAAVIAMLSVGGNDPGIGAGALCNKLHVNTLFPLAITSKKASSSTTATATSWFPSTPFKWDNLWAGTQLYWQAAWEDSKSKAFSLTAATKLTLAKKPIYKAGSNDAQYAGEYHYKTNTSPSRFWYFNGTGFYNPIERWTKK